MRFLVILVRTYLSWVVVVDDADCLLCEDLRGVVPILVVQSLHVSAEVQAPLFLRRHTIIIEMVSSTHPTDPILPMWHITWSYTTPCCHLETV